MYDFSCLITGNFKSFTWRASWGDGFTCTPVPVHSQWTAVSEELQLRTQASLAGHALSQICILSPETFILGSLYLSPWAEELYETEGHFDDTSPYSESAPNTFLLPTPSSRLFSLKGSKNCQGPKNCQSLLAGAPAATRWPLHLCWPTWPWISAPIHEGKGRGGFSTCSGFRLLPVTIAVSD